MGLRIGTNVPGLRAVRTLRQNSTLLERSLERLSTGLRINRASDDPAGLVISEQLSSQINALEQASRNTQDSNNLLNTADSALGEIQTILSDIKDSIVFAQNTGGATPAQIAAEQDAVDNAISAIDRIASSTRFADRSLLNGTAGITTVSTVPTGVDNLQIRSATFNGTNDTRSISIDVNTAAERGEVTVSSAATTATSTLRVSGAYGTEDVNLASGATASDITDAINTVAESTGVYAELSGADVVTRTGEFGEDALLQLEVVSGTVTGLGGAGSKTSDRGVDAEIEFEGQSFTGIGNSFSVLANVAQLEFDLASGTAAGSNLSFSIRNTGLEFQLGSAPRQTDQLSISIENVGSAVLGLDTFTDQVRTAAGGSTVTSGGFLNSITTGGDNDLTDDPDNASLIVDAAINQVSRLRGFLGAAQSQNLEPNERFLGVQIENLSSSLSTIRDLDFAEETSEYAKLQVLQQANVSVLAAANLIPQNVLALLGNGA